jgi:hypothetical protein
MNLAELMRKCATILLIAFFSVAYINSGLAQTNVLSEEERIEKERVELRNATVKEMQAIMVFQIDSAIQYLPLKMLN